MEEKLNTCDKCKYWQGNSNEMRKCKLSKSKHPMMFSGCGLYTRKDFGCILHQKK
jgi:hypothetical protein